MKARSQFPQLQTCPAVWAFLKQTMKIIENLSFPRHITGSLTQVQQSALTSIIQNDQIIVKPADKGVNVVVMYRNQHKQMCETILNHEWYQQVSGDLLISAILVQAYQQALIDEDLFEYLEVKWPITPTY